MRLLVYTPTWIDKGVQALHPKVRAAIERAIAATRAMSVDIEWVIGTDNPWPVPDHRNVLHQYQRARKQTLTLEYDALLTIEHDNLLPDDGAIARLLDTPGDVIYAPYQLRHGMTVLNLWQYINDRNLGMSLSHYPDELAQARAAGVHRVSGTGFGCTLIYRRVLEALEFTGATDRDRNACPDLRFAADCLRRGFIANGRFDMPVLHYSRGEWLHPYQIRSNAMGTYVALETKNVFTAGRIVRLERGKPIDLTDEEAADLARLGTIQAAIDDDDRISIDELIADDAARVHDKALAPETVTQPVPASAAEPTPPPTRRNREKTVKGKS